jgi:hypothetical protein
MSLCCDTNLYVFYTASADMSYSRAYKAQQIITHTNHIGALSYELPFNVI